MGGNLTDECKGFGFLDVSTEDFADKIALFMKNFDFGGRKCEMRKSEPKTPGGQGGGKPNFGKGGYQQNYQQGYGQGGYGGYGGYGYGGYGPPAPSYGGRGGHRYHPY